jgi:hypothetical protein
MRGELGERRERRVALCRAPWHLDHGAIEALATARPERPDAEGHDRRRACAPRADLRRAAASILADLLAVQIRRDRLDLAVQLLDVGAHQPRHSRAHTRRSPPPVGVGHV